MTAPDKARVMTAAIAAVTVVEIAVATVAAEAVDAGAAAEAAAEAVVAVDAIKVDKAADAIFPRQNTLRRKVATAAAAHRVALTKIAAPVRQARAIAVRHTPNRAKTISFCPARVSPSIARVPYNP